MTAERRERWRHLVAVPVALLFVLPLVFMVSGSLRPSGLPPPRSPELVHWPPSPENYGRAFELADLATYAVNSAFVAAVVVPLSVAFASWAAFAMTRLGRRAAGTLLVVSLLALMLPATTLLLGRFTIFGAMGVLDTYWPLLAPALVGTSPFSVLLFYWSFRRLPAELMDAARVEGLSPFQTWRRVAMPLARPVTVAVAVLAFVATWGNFLDPLIYLFDQRLFTLPLGLRSLAELDRSNFPIFLAGAVVATAPVLAVLVVAQRLIAARPRW